MVHHVIKGQDGSLKVARTDLGNDDTFQLVYAGVFYYVVIYTLPVVLLAAMTYRHMIINARLSFNTNVETEILPLALSTF